MKTKKSRLLNGFLRFLNRHNVDLITPMPDGEGGLMTVKRKQQRELVKLYLTRRRKK